MNFNIEDKCCGGCRSSKDIPQCCIYTKEFLLSLGYSLDTDTCPDCGHLVREHTDKISSELSPDNKTMLNILESFLTDIPNLKCTCPNSIHTHNTPCALTLFSSKISTLFINYAVIIEQTSLKLDHIIGTLPVGLAICKVPSAQLEFCNSAYRDIVGACPDKNNIEWFIKLIHEDDAHLVHNAISRLSKSSHIEDNLTLPTVLRFVKNGKITWALSFMAFEPFTNKIINILIDISQQKEIEKELEETQAYMKAQSVLSPNGICRMDSDGHLVWVNDKWLQIAGFALLEEAKGFQWSRHCVNASEVSESWMSYVEDRKKNPSYDSPIFKQNQSFLHEDGKVVDVLAQAVPVHKVINGELTLISFVAAVTDITELKRAYVSISDQETLLRQQAEFFRQESDNLLYHVCHTFKNQLQGLKLAIESISLMHDTNTSISQIHDSKTSKTKIPEFFVQLYDIVHDLHQIYDKLEHITLFELDLFKLKSGITKLIYVVIDLVKIQSWLYSSYQDFAQKKSLSFSCTVTGQRFIKSDSKRLEMLLCNLIDNAMKYTQKGSVTVLIHADENNNRLFIQVCDTGKGISSEFIDSGEIFKQFARESSVILADFEGFGLGLPSCKAFLDAVKGLINIKSEVGKGSVFSVELPYTHPSDKELSETDQRLPSVQSTPIFLQKTLLLDSPHSYLNAVSKTDSWSKLGGEKTKPLSGLKVLLAEDSSLNFKLFKSLLVKAGVENVCHARNGLEAIQKWDPSFDIIWMDIQMPVISGTEAAEILRQMFATINKHDHALKIPYILACSADPVQRHKKHQDLFDAYVLKPFSIEDIITLISQLMQKRKN